MIAIPVKDRSEDPIIDDRFGRGEMFCIVDKNNNFKIIENSAKDLTSGAGGMAVSLLADEDVTVIISPHIGPKAMDAIEALNIQAYDMGLTKTVTEAIKSLELNRLKMITKKQGLRRV